MKKFVACLAVLACVAPSATAGTVDFGGPYEVIVGTGEVIEIPVTITSTDGGAFTTVDFAIGSDTVAMIPDGPAAFTDDDDIFHPHVHSGDWTYSDAVFALVIESVFELGVPVVIDGPLVGGLDAFPHGLRSIGANFILGDPSAPFLLGTLRVDTAGLGLGDHFLYIGDLLDRGGSGGDPDGRDGGFSKVAYGNGSIESLQGTGVIRVIVPEPATLALLGLGAIGFIARRKKA